MTTRNSRPRAGVVALAAVALTATVLTGPARASADTATGHQATQDAIDAAVAAGVPGVTAEARDAGGVWKSASGVGDRETGAPRGKNDRFRTGSITNTFVATVLLQMEAENKLSLDDTVEHWLPGVVTGNGNDGSKITVRQLLNHTSGLFDYLADVTYYETYTMGDSFLQHRYDTLTPGQRLQVAFSHAPQFEPGARHSFSHTNDILAALIVEKVGGTSYEKEVRKRIIKPLGLDATSNPGTGTGLPRPSSRGYSKLFYASQPDRIDDVTELNGSQGWGDGDIISSAGDLNRFYKALMGGKLLPAEQLAEMKTTVVNPDFPISSYGLGIERLTMGCGTTLWYHDGGMVGSLALAAFTEDGRHELTFDYNGDWDASGILPILNAEFCAPTSR
ncbi:serine hydrolase domain-containing protein [Streptomyces sp. NPDC054766]|uniref:serine hydrolase domain-containing protein n=1 Tax=Streptomyces rhizosphaerihabitans TaxID=1266770 RepID=UPI0021C0E7FA|nr:beta-lactamase family protein [Streptomyces rhizosphaerihabitans]MCT9008793.1 beta-lactamase family protein [Streptomyces rhizosphaerihabitans]